MAVHLAGNLPADELNGLAQNESKLLEGHLARQKHLIVGVVQVTGTKASIKNGFSPEPVVTLVHVEAVPEELGDDVLGLLRKLVSNRTTKGDTIEFPDDEHDSTPDIAEPLELEAGDGAYGFSIVDQANGRFGLTVHTPSGAEVTKRNNLMRKEYGTIPPGDYQLIHLAEFEALQALAAAIVREYEAGMLAGTDEVVDAEVVDDEGEIPVDTDGNPDPYPNGQPDDVEWIAPEPQG